MGIVATNLQNAQPDTESLGTGFLWFLLWNMVFVPELLNLIITILIIKQWKNEDKTKFRKAILALCVCNIVIATIIALLMIGCTFTMTKDIEMIIYLVLISKILIILSNSITLARINSSVIEVSLGAQTTTLILSTIMTISYYVIILKTLLL